MGDVVTAKPMTASQQLRKVRKPLIERKRRERINGCLNELKSLVLDALNKDEAQFSKLEKADILELALEVLRKKQKQQMSPLALAPEPSVIASKYTAGFSQCALEVARCLGTIQGVKPEIRVHLTEHLAGCVQKLAKVANTIVDQTVNTSALDTGYAQNNTYLTEGHPQIPTQDSSAISNVSLVMPSQYPSSTSVSRSSPASNVGYTLPITSTIHVAIPVTSSIPVYTTQQVERISPPQVPPVPTVPQVGIVHPLKHTLEFSTSSEQFSPCFGKDSSPQTGFYGYAHLQKINPVVLVSAGPQIESRENVWRPWS